MVAAQEKIADLKIKVNRKELPRQALIDIRSLTVQEDMKAAGMFVIDFNNWDNVLLRYKWSDGPLFSPGLSVEIWFGYLGSLKKVLTGEIGSIEPSFQAGSLPTVKIRGYDLSYKMRSKTHTETYENATFDQIASKIARRQGLTPQITPLSPIQDPGTYTQKNVSDMDFLQQKAELIGYEAFVRHKNLYFKPEVDLAVAHKILSLDKEIIDFSPRLSVQSQVTKVIVTGSNNGEQIKGEARIGQEKKMGAGTFSGPEMAKRVMGNNHVLTINRPVDNKKDADRIALGQFRERSLSYVEGDGTCFGDPELLSGQVIQITGAGKSFSGPYLVSSTTHSISSSDGYRTSFSVRRNAA